jgi:hypothetical protein
MEQPIGEGEGKGWELTLCFKNRHFVKLGQPYALVDFNPTSHQALTPVRGLRIWAQSGESGEVAPHTFTLYSSSGDVTCDK